jgi:FtsP/CotA-like multicopper oxidase with cupredoxin domain
VPEAEKPHFFKHICPPRFVRQVPLDSANDGGYEIVHIERHLMRHHHIMSMEGDSIERWVIGDKPDPRPDPDPDLTFPSPLIRVKQGVLVYATVGAHTNTHTIHWHGIEPSPYNDGVGKHSFEIIEGGQGFVYRWLAAEPGFYFYHCHKNTPLHFEMGLYGALIIDPLKPSWAAGTDPSPPYPAGGRGFVAGFDAANGRDVFRYDKEAVWVADDIDMDWTRLNHSAFMMGCGGAVEGDPMNPGNFTSGGILNRFNPTYFGINGVVQRLGSKQNLPAPVAVTVVQGERLLLRILNAAYDLTRWTLPLDALVIAMDGRPLGATASGLGYSKYSGPFRIPKNTPFTLTTARRWDLLVDAPFLGSREKNRVGTVAVDFYDYMTRRKHHTAKTTITITRA